MDGNLHIGLIPTVAPYLLPLIIPEIKKHFPNLELYLHEDQTDVLVKQLEAGELDCLILAVLPNMGMFQTYTLYREPLELALSENHQWADKKTVDLKKSKLLG